MIADFVIVSFIPLPGKFKTDFLIEFTNNFHAKMTIDFFNETFIHLYGKFQTGLVIELSNSFIKKNNRKFR